MESSETVKYSKNFCALDDVIWQPPLGRRRFVEMHCCQPSLCFVIDGISNSSKIVKENVVLNCSWGYCYKWIQVGHCGHWSETHSSSWWSQHFQVSRRWSPPSSSALAPEKHGTIYISKPAVEEEALPRPKETFELLRLAQLSHSCFTDAVNLPTSLFPNFPYCSNDPKGSRADSKQICCSRLGQNLACRWWPVWFEQMEGGTAFLVHSCRWKCSQHWKNTLSPTELVLLMNDELLTADSAQSHRYGSTHIHSKSLFHMFWC